MKTQQPTVRTAAFLPLLLALAGSPAAAQATDGIALGESPFGHMHMLFERTIFNVDVLTLDVCFDAATADVIAAFARDGRNGSDNDSIALAAIRTPAALGRITFMRGVSRSQFLDGIRDEQENAVQAGLLDEATFRMIGDSLPVWFDFLDERGIHDGDRITYVFRDDSLRTVYRGADGEQLLDRTDVGENRRTSVLATWFAPGSGFRGPLLSSLDRDQSPDPAACALPGDTDAPRPRASRQP